MRKNLSEQKILQATLELIDEKGSSTGVNFRGIARRLGCAHTSIYNLYNSYSDLQLEALYEVRKRMLCYVMNNIADQNQEFDFLNYIAAVIDFNMKHRGWYKFLWMDSHTWKMEDVVKPNERPDRMFVKELMELSGGVLNEKKAERVHGIMHAYYHGELMKFMNGRSPIVHENDVKKIIMENLNFMYKSMTETIRGEKA
ncbi:MAG: hypothetical protein C0604_05875 [Clostridiales bacterium]|nr:MAG: hypothetical protein C0604_05875 [Clostridiales bacterium]